MARDDIRRSPMSRSSSCKDSGWQIGKRSASSSLESSGLTAIAASQKFAHHLHARPIVPNICRDFPIGFRYSRHFTQHRLVVWHKVQHQTGHSRIKRITAPRQGCRIGCVERHPTICDLLSRYGDKSFGLINHRNRSWLGLSKNALRQRPRAAANVYPSRSNGHGDPSEKLCGNFAAPPTNI